MPRQFDKAYYDRFYRNPRTRAATPQSARRLADLVVAFLKHHRIGIRSITDIGCGLGHVLAPLGQAFPKASLTGVEFSEYLCAQYGWQRGSVIDYQPSKPQDLVICNDVVCYLDQTDASKALRNLAEITGKALFFGALTKEDWDNCDQGRTDPDQHMRSASWYRRRLRDHFEPIGGGLYLKRPVDTVIWSLDRMSR